MILRSLNITILSILLSISINSNVNAETENECFEKVSRGIFKFNQGFDNIILEPVAKAYNRLPEPIRNGTGNLLPTLPLYYQFQITFCKVK